MSDGEESSSETELPIIFDIYGWAAGYDPSPALQGWVVSLGLPPFPDPPPPSPCEVAESGDPLDALRAAAASENLFAREEAQRALEEATDGLEGGPNRVLHGVPLLEDFLERFTGTVEDFTESLCECPFCLETNEAVQAWDSYQFQSPLGQAFAHWVDVLDNEFSNPESE